MPDESFGAGSASDWLRYAHSDLALSRVPRPREVMLETLCYHAQQAAEKALKAALVHVGIAPPYTHNLRTLLDALSSSLVVPPEIDACSELSVYATETRYPAMPLPPVDEDEYSEAVALAEAAVIWVEGLLREDAPLSTRQ